MDYIETENKTLLSYLSFRLGKELFALEVDNVIEIVDVPRITQVPRAPEYMRGLVNLRGKILPLIDTCVKFGLKPIEITNETTIIVIELNINEQQAQFGVLVDEVMDVLEESPENLKESPTLNAGYKLEFIKGLIEVDDKFLMLINMNKVFSVEDLKEVEVANN